MKTLAAVAVLFAFIAGAAIAGGGDPLGIARAVEAWAGAKVQVAQIDAGVETYRIGVEAVQRANDRGLMYMLLGAGIVLVVLLLPRIMRHWESEADHYERMSREQDRDARRRATLSTAQRIHADDYARRGFDMVTFPSDDTAPDALVPLSPSRRPRAPYDTP